MGITLQDKVREYILDHDMIRKGEHVCAAVSGGADSMCLLFLLYDLRDSMGFSLSAVHVEHGIRGQASVDDMDYVAGECKRLDIPVTLARVDAVKKASISGATLEEAARNERYRVFDGVAADKIALAHHMDDQAETFLFNAARGTGLKGLRGIMPVRDRYIRPLLNATRKETEDYCGEHGIRYRHDDTNDDTCLSRNHIRHEVIPELIKINDRAVFHISDTAEELQDVEACISHMTEKAFSECVRQPEDGRLEIDIDLFEKLDDVIAARVLKLALVMLSGRAKDISRRHINSLIRLSKGQSGHHADLIYGIKAYKEFRKLVIRGTGRYELPSGDHEEHKPSRLYFEIIDVSDSDRRSFIDKSKEAESYTKFIDYATIKDASLIELRHRLPGDYISIKGGTKKLKDLLIEERIPKDKRDSLLFAAEGREIIWIPYTGRIGERFMITDDTVKILRMEIRDG